MKVAGGFTGTVDFDPGAGINNLSSTSKGFSLQLDANGNFVNAVDSITDDFENIYSVPLNDLIGVGYRDMTRDNNGNYYFTGTFNDTIDFDPGPGTQIEISLYCCLGNIFVLKLDANLNYEWVQTYGSSEDTIFAIDEENGSGIALDDFGNVYVTGIFIGRVDFDHDPGTGYVGTPFSQHDIFILKLDTNGNFKWAESIQGSSNSWEDGNKIYAAPSGNIYVTGFYESVVDVDPNGGTYILDDPSYFCSKAIFLTKLDSSGNFIWGKTISKDRGTHIHKGLLIDNDENLYQYGEFQGNIFFDILGFN